MIQLSWDTHTHPPKEAVSLSLLGRWSWPFFHTSPHVHPPCLEMIQLDNQKKPLHLPKKISADAMTQNSSLKGWDKYHSWQVKRWQGCAAGGKATTFGKSDVMSSAILQNFFILPAWPTSNGVGMRKFDNFKTFTYIYTGYSSASGWYIGLPSLDDLLIA